MAAWQCTFVSMAHSIKMTPLKKFGSSLLLSLTQFQFSAFQVDAGMAKSCSDAQLSCHNTSSVADTCCFNAPGGQLLQTQFWDTSPPVGPSNSWTIHGLWPDLCDGTYEANCDPAREYTNITAILQSYGRQDLLSYMNQFWLPNSGSAESFWEHEWGKHGTCVSTLDPTCYSDYSPTQEAVDYFDKTVSLFKTLNTYSTLAAAGITPSNSKTYLLADIQGALYASFGHQVTLGCHSGVFDEVWYHFNIRGSLQGGQFVPTDPDGGKSTCPTSGIKYLPKSGTSPTTSTTGPTDTSLPGSVFSGSGFLKVRTGGNDLGCIISSAKWYNTASCATFHASPQGSQFTLTSSKGPCGIISGSLVCSSSTSAALFSQTGGFLVAPGGSSTLYADSAPAGTSQSSVYVTSHSTSLQISWQAF